MTITVNTDTYISVADADAYFATRPFSTAWTGTTTDKENALRAAAKHLDRLFRWKGVSTSQTQVMKWPRTGIYNEDGIYLSPDTVPQDVKDAQCELAYQWIQADQLTPGGSSFTFADTDNQLGGIHRKKLGDLEIEYNRPEHSTLFASVGGYAMIKKVYPLVNMLVKPYVFSTMNEITAQIVA